MSRKPRSKPLRRRPSRTVAASITAIFLLAIGVGLVWMSVARLLNGAWPGFLASAGDWLTSLTWNSPAMWAISLGTALIGLVLLLAALIPGKYNGTRVQGKHDDGRTPTEVILSRRAITRLATAHADRMDGVDSSSAKTNGKRVRLNITTPLREPRELRDRVTTSVTERLRAAGLNPPPRVTADVRSHEV